MRPRALTRQAAELARGMLERAAAAQATDVLPVSELKVGMPLEVIDPDSRTLFPFGTQAGPVSAHHLLVHVLPRTCRVVRVDGAWRIELDAPIAEYVRSGALREFAVAD